MKKITFLILLLCVSFSGIAQIAEGFETDPPAGWTFMQTEGDDPDWVEFKIELNEMTQTTFVRIQEYNDFDDKEEQAEVWDGLLHTLKETVGG